MQRPFFSQSPKRVGSGPLRPPISTGRGGSSGKTAALFERSTEHDLSRLFAIGADGLSSGTWLIVELTE